ncbi:Mitochondrial fission ELM1 [Phytophthora infestans]|uniref:Mitochondrial fission ELM1 n=1 Tax=Phytophthora infestans TaxID=4787 RepID=A0A833T5F3_PHYIN|nr:Mitochondrial fission ELM1 [Phytophthora infestans]
MSLVRLVVLRNGAAGAEKQALALAARLRTKLLDEIVPQRLGVVCSPVECVDVTLGRSHVIPPVLQVFGAKLTRNPLFGYKEQGTCQVFSVQKKTGELNVVIGCGRSTVALCAVVKQLEPKRTFNVQIQHPRVPLTWFDAIVAPRHDFSRGKSGANNLFLTSGTVHNITPELLHQHGSEWSEELDEKLQKRRKRVVWLLGGPCRGFAFTEQDTEKMVDEFIRALPGDDDVAVLVTFSRRTPQNVRRIIGRCLDVRFPAPGQLLVFEGTERRNPYYALLSTASCIVTTPDSISMTTEAVASGKPVFTIGVKNCKGKFLRFHQDLFETKATAPFTADAVAASLRGIAEDDVSSSATNLEEEISAIVNSIVSAIHTVQKQILCSTTTSVVETTGAHDKHR